MENSGKSFDFMGISEKQQNHIKKALLWLDCIMMLGISIMIILD